MELLRIGDKILSRQQIDRWVSRILELRQLGHSQQDVAQQLKIDRTFISRLESLGELRKGRGVAVLGFPVANGPELEAICVQYGVDWWLFLSERQRQKFVKEKKNLDLFNEVLEILAAIRNHNTVVVIGSNKRVKITEALLDRDVISMELGESPLDHDVEVDTQEFKQIIQTLCSEERRG